MSNNIAQILLYFSWNLKNSWSTFGPEEVFLFLTLPPPAPPSTSPPPLLSPELRERRKPICKLTQMPSLKAEIVPFISETKSSVHIIAIEQIFAANKIIDIMSAFIVQEAHKPGTLKTVSEPAVTSVTLSLLGQPPFMSSPSAQVQWDPHSDTVVLSTCSEGTWFITREGG